MILTHGKKYCQQLQLTYHAATQKEVAPNFLDGEHLE
ncbi:hypothetical protein ACP4OV_012595 [Aristida adscensionis]